MKEENMKKSKVPKIVLLVLGSAIVLTACAGPGPENHTFGTWDNLSEVADTGIMTFDLHGAFEGVLTISRGSGRDRMAMFDGTVAGQSGGFVGSITVLGNGATTPITILSGSGELESIRGQITTYMNSSGGESGTYGGWFNIGGS
jgi:hypothetical protein